MRIPRQSWMRGFWCWLLVMGILVPTLAQAVTVTFPDANLEAKIRATINKQTGAIDDSDLANLTTLIASSSNITDLSGLQYCTALRSLSLFNNNITDISQLAQLTNLRDLFIWDNQISSIAALANLTNLRYIFIQNNNIVDLRPLENNVGLGQGDTINLVNNPLDQYSVCTVARQRLKEQLKVAVYFDDTCNQPRVYFPDPNLDRRIREVLNYRLSGDILEVALQSLKDLPAASEGIVDLTGLSHCTNLRTLDLSYNNISDLSELSGLAQLSTLKLGGNKIASVTPLASLANLQWLELHDNNLSNLNGLGSLGGLAGLLLHDNQISSINILSNLPNLMALTLNDNQISSLLPLKNLFWLAHLQLGHNNISSISDLSNLVNLVDLGLEDNSISDASAVSGMTWLANLDLSDNALISLEPLALLSNLVNLDASNNFINNISVLAGLTSLDKVTLRNNRISDITPLVANTGLKQESFISHDQVDVRGNLLSQENLCQDIPTLLARGVQIYYDGVCDLYGQTYSLTTSVSPAGTGTVDPPEGTRRFSAGTEVRLEAKPGPGFVFFRWEGDVISTNNPTTVTLDSDMRLTAVFREPVVNYTLQISVDGQGTVNPAVGSHAYPSGDAVSVTATPAAGWAFDHWEGDAQASMNEISIQMDRDKAIKAVFRQLGPYYNLTTSVQGNGTISPIEGVTHRYLKDEAVVLTATPDVGWVLDRWEWDGDLHGNTSPNALVMDDNKSVTAVFVRDGLDHTLTISVNGHGTTSPAPGYSRAADDSIFTITATPEEGYVFDHWTGDLTGDANPATITMDGNKSVHAVFVAAPVIYTLTLNAGEGGELWPPEGIYPHPAGKKVTVQAIPEIGYTFDHWEGALGGTGNPVMITMNGHSEITAVFAPHPYVSDVTPGTGLISGGDTVVVTGLNLETTSAVYFGTAQAEIQSVSATEVRATSPAHAAGIVDVALVSGTKTTSQTRAFTYLAPTPPPAFGELSPQRGSIAGGEVVTIRGFNFALVNEVTFGGEEALILFAQATRLVVMAPPAAVSGPVDVVITSPMGASTATDAFSYCPIPSIGSVTPAFGYAAGGEMVVITGTDLAETTSVKFGGTEASILSVSEEEITALTPAHSAGAVSVSVTTPGGLAMLPDGYQYYIGDASVSVRLLDGTTQDPVEDATVRLSPLELVISDGPQGFYLFENLLPGQYAVSVITPSCQAMSFAVEIVDGQQYETTVDLTCPSIPKEGDPPCGLGIDVVGKSIAEPTMPLSLEHAPETSVDTNAPLAVRLTAEQAIDPESVWATVESDSVSATGGVWQPAQNDNDQDGWVVFTPQDGLPDGETVTMTVGAETVDGGVVGPVTKQFFIGAEKSGTRETGLVQEMRQALPSILAAPVSSAYRVGPAGIFAEPETVRLPVPNGSKADDLEIYYFSEAAEHAGWYLAQNVEGFMVPDSRRTVQIDGVDYIEFKVNHSGIVQLGKGMRMMLGTASPVEVAVTGSHSLWISLISVVLVLSFMLGRIVKRNARKPREQRA